MAHPGRAAPVTTAGRGVGLLRASHPGPTATVTVIATALALGARRDLPVALLASAVLSGQLSIGWGNDLMDRERDRAAGRSDKPLVVGSVSVPAVRTASALALAACVPLSLTLGVRAGVLHLVAVAAGWAYNGGLKRTVLSVAPYAVAFGLLPVVVSLSGPAGAWPPVRVVLSAALLGSGAHFIDALPDLDADRATAVRGLPQRLGRRGSVLGGTLLMAGCVVLLASAGGPGGATARAALAVAATMLIGMATVAVAGPPRWAWRLAMGTSVAVTVAFVLGGGAAVG